MESLNVFACPFTKIFLVYFLGFILASSNVSAQEIQNFYRFSIPVRVWTSDCSSNQSPKGIIIGIHGLAMHSGSFEALAKSFTDNNYLFVAPDLRGFGRWQETHQKDSDLISVDYESSCQDIGRIISFMQLKYPNIPTYLIGESLGADLAIKVTSYNNYKINGLILSAPAIINSAPILPSVVASELPKVIHNPKHEISLKPFLKKYVSTDDKITEYANNDPLVRKNLTLADLLLTLKTLTSTLDFAKKVDKYIPVLILQGDKDNIINPRGVDKLVKNLNCNDTLVKMYPNDGHLLLETGKIPPKATLAINNWVNQHNSIEPTTLSLAEHNNVFPKSNN